MKRRRNQRSALLFTVSLVALIASPAWGQVRQSPLAPAIHEPALTVSPDLTTEQPQRKIGPPQVLEIPPFEVPSAAPSLSEEATRAEQNPPDEPSEVLVHPLPSSRPGFLGILYATAEEGPSGVRVLGVVPGSPAERAGFSASPASPTRTEQVLGIGLVMLAFTPVGFLAMPLLMAHNAYYSQTPDQGDLVVAIEEQPVRNVQTFNDIMRRFGPGDSVTFTVQRERSRVRLSAQLEAEP